MNVNSDSNNVVHLEVGKLYMLALNSNRQYYWLYGDAFGTARVNVAEPFLVIKTGCPLNGFNNMVLVCNVRGEVGMTYPRSDIIPYLSQ